MKHPGSYLNKILAGASFIIVTVFISFAGGGEANPKISAKVPGKKPSASAAKKNPVDTAFENIPVGKWVGKKFVLLAKTKPFQQYGYELYTSPLLSKAPGKPCLAIELSNHRLRYEPFHTHTVSVKTVRASGKGEYLITFLTDTLNLTVYGITKHGTIEGIAGATDLVRAEKRWIGTTVFSRRRSIDQFDPATGTFSGRKVSVLEPLSVTAVRWGILPLPPKPVWLFVKSSGGDEGIIPVYTSWTNVQQSFKSGIRPWDEEIFEKNPKSLFQWDQYVWETIDNHAIFLGMTVEQVKISWGEPKKILPALTPEKKPCSIYFYEGKKVTFVDDSLTKEE